jgi:fibronectin-binding autotransporter adhesin
MIGSGATLGNGGTIKGVSGVTISNGGVLSPHAGHDAGGGPVLASELTIDGDLTLNAGSVLDYHFGAHDVVGGSYNAHTLAKGDLTLGGTINVSETTGGSFDPGIYQTVSDTSCRSSPDSYISIMMSEPPMNSPLT